MPLGSVRGLIWAGFGLLVFILALMSAGAAWQVAQHQSDVDQLEYHSTRASLIQNVEAQAGIAALLLQRYVDAGGDAYVEEINTHAANAQLSLQQVVNMGGPAGFEEVTTQGLQLLSEASRAAELRRLGSVDLARQVLEDIVPIFRDYRLTLESFAAEELAEVARLRDQAQQTGDLTFFLLVVSGVSGVVLGVIVSVLIARSVIRPLGALEETALAVSKGNLDARVAVSRPREFAHLGRTINTMMTTIQDRSREVEERNRQLLDARALASTDGLTGVLNHRTFQERLRGQIADASLGSPVALIMLDIDFFKQINDRLGHQKGDEILRNVTDRCTRAAGQDNVYRYGGDEIAVIVPAGGLTEAEGVAERLREMLSKISVDDMSITVSLGVASYPETAGTAEELIYQSDTAMYAAKSTGKNRVARWDTVTGMTPLPPGEFRRSQPEADAAAVSEVPAVVADLAAEMGVTPDQLLAELEGTNESALAGALARVLKRTNERYTSGYAAAASRK